MCRILMFFINPMRLSYNSYRLMLVVGSEGFEPPTLCL